MRQAYVVCYDVSDPKRLRKVFKVLRGYGQHVQLSVFRCDLDETKLVQLKQKLRAVIHHDEDQVLFIDMGPADGRAVGAITSLGRAYVPSEGGAVVV
jgi:CRISPR-associated protein Cas2